MICGRCASASRDLALSIISGTKRLTADTQDLRGGEIMSGPTELADGLALAAQALLADHRKTRPKKTWVLRSSGH
jgi:hypothetical protein